MTDHRTPDELTDLLAQLREPDRYGQTFDDKCRAADELDRQRAEIEQLRTLLRIARDEWYDDNGQWGDGFGLKHWTRKADVLLSGDSSFHELEKRHE